MSQPTAGSTLEHTSWQLEAFVGSDDDPTQRHEVLAESNVTLEFSDGGRVGGSAGCNRYFAACTITGAQLSIGTPGATRMMCGPEIMQQEFEYLHALEASERFQITADGRLEIVYNGGKQYLNFRPITAW